MAELIEHKNVFGIQASLCRTDKLDGRDCWVFPVIMMTEGVHNGSGGPVLYSKEELAQNLDSWNMKPVVVRHPMKDGTPISACSSDVIEKQGIGVLLNTMFDEGKLKSEAWCYQDKIDKVAPGLSTKLRNGQMQENSTGVFFDCIETLGKWNDEEYSAIASNCRADHLAIILEGKGACSIADGAGFPRINAASDIDLSVLPDNELLVLKTNVDTILDNKTKQDNEITVLEQEKLLVTEAKALITKQDLRTNKDMSHDELRCALRVALDPKQEVDTAVEVAPLSEYCYIQEVYDNYFIYEEEPSSKLYKRDYSLMDGKVELSDVMEEVEKKVVYEEVTNEVTNNEQRKEFTMNETVIERLKTAGLSEAAVSAFNALEEADVTAIEALLEEKVVEKSVENVEVKEEVKEEVVNEEVVTPEPVTMEALLASAPTNMREAIEEGIRLNAQKRDSLVGTIVANKQNKFTKDDLISRSTTELEKIAALVSNTADYRINGASIAAPSGETPMGLPKSCSK